MRQISCDVAIIGAGTAGLAARAAADGDGARTVLIDAGPGGTTCARVGCMPSKLVIAAAAAMKDTERLGLFGLRLEGRVAVDGPAVMDRVRRERDRFVGSVLENVADIPAEQRIAGRARFTGPTSLRIDDHTEIEARAIVIATGSKSAVPKVLSGLGEIVLTNETVFELPEPPPSLAVIGAGPLGIELAQAFARLGTRVTVFDKADRIAGLADPAAAGIVRDLLSVEIELRLGVEIEAEPAAEGGAKLRWRGAAGAAGATGEAVFARVLAAAGRPPNLSGLNLDRAGLALDPHGTPVFDRATMRCGASAVFLAGDAGHDRPVLHEAAAEGRIAGLNAARFPRVEPMPRQVPLSIVYTDPEIAVVGRPWSEEEDFAVGDADLGQSGRARVMGRNAGVIRVYACRDGGRIEGGTIVGPEAEHLGHLLAWTVQCGMTVDAVLALPFYHPTLEESFRGAIRKLCGETRSRPPARPGDLEFGPGV
ncbi:dihydrolipoyl dehydrogenase [uncultured Enterovirga sp.]|uniref:dihydrolipoyl dehydrogenase n=1 Tax=uncultured Enterovirga sp. TaxID=2026352 RepID=UPI0035CB6EDC